MHGQNTMYLALREALRERLRARPYPILAERDASKLRLMPGAAIWPLAIESIRAWRRAGVMQGDILVDSPAGIDGVVRVVAALVGGYVYWPMPTRCLAGLSERPVGTSSEQRTSDRCVWRMPPDPSACPVALCSPAGLDELGTLPVDTALLLETSGTSSGRPALIALGATALLHQLNGHAQALDLREGEVRACILPWWNAFGLVLDLLLGLWSGQELWLAPEGGRQPRKLLSLCRDEEVEHLAAVPRVVQLLLDEAADAPALTRLRVHSGGARTGSRLVRHARQKFGSCLEGYGLTECGPGVLLDGHPVDCEVKLEATFDEVQIRTASLGHFVERPERLDAEGWFRSHDVAHRLADGRFEILGRSGAAWKDPSGYWVTPLDIERWLEVHCAMKEFGVSRRPTGELHLAVAVEARTKQSIFSLEQNLGRSFSRRFGVDAELRACLWTENARDRVLQLPARSPGEALLSHMYASQMAVEQATHR